MRPYCRAHTTQTVNKEPLEWKGSMEKNWKRWENKMMELMDMPYHSCQAVTNAREVAIGDS